MNNIESETPNISEEDLQDLRKAKVLLENISVGIQLANIAQKPIEYGLSKLPAKWQDMVSTATNKALHSAIGLLNNTFPKDQKNHRAFPNWHKAGVILSGAGGGLFGLVSLPVELPVSTGIMIRSIMDTARSEGFDVSQETTKLLCLEVLALGGGDKPGDKSAAYYAVRSALAKVFEEAAQFITQRGIIEEGAPIIVRVLAQISSRFGVVVSEKAAVEAIPVAGAITGASINYIFIQHFQNMARGHFIVKRLEKVYGYEVVRHEYDKLSLKG
jgi:hypothetical protein